MVEETHKVLKLANHPSKSLGSFTDIVFVETSALVNNFRFAISYLDNVYVRQTSSLRSNVN